MVIYLGADHRGFALKKSLQEYLAAQGYEVLDMGAETLDPGDDFPKYAVKVATAAAAAPDKALGILMCGSGTGMDIAANKVPHARAVLAISTDQVAAARHDDNANVLVIAADFANEEEAKKYADVFIKTPFASDERYRRRLKEIEDIEQGNV